MSGFLGIDHEKLAKETGSLPTPEEAAAARKSLVDTALGVLSQRRNPLAFMAGPFAVGPTLLDEGAALAGVDPATHLSEKPKPYSPGAFTPKDFTGGTAAGGGLSALAAGPAQATNPLLAAVQKDPSLLGKMVSAGSTSSYSRTYQPGLKKEAALYQKGIERTASAQKDAIRSGAEAQRLGLAQKQTAMNLRQAELDFAEGEREKMAAEQQAGVEEFNAKMTAMREEISAAKDLDASRWFSSRSVGQKIALGLSAALQGFIQGYRGQQGPNPVLQMMERAIDRDLKVQERNYDRKRGELKDTQGAYAIFRQQGMDKEQAMAQTKIGILERYKSRFENIADKTQSALIKANAELAAAGADKQVAAEKFNAAKAALPRVSSSGTSRRVPLAQILKGQLAQKKPLKAPTPEIRKMSAGANAARRDLIGLLNSYNKISVRPGFTGWAGGAGDAVNEQRKLVLDKVAAGMGMASATQLKMIKNALGTKWSSKKDMVTRIRNVLHVVDAVQEEGLAAEAPYTNVKPLATRALASQKLTRHALPGKGH